MFKFKTKEKTKKKPSLEVPRDCYTTADKKRCTSSMGHCYVFHNSRLCFNLYTQSDSKLYLIYYSVIDVVLVLIGLTYIAVIIYSNCNMFLETRRQKKRLGTEQLPNEEAKRMKKDSKAANTLAFVVCALTLTYLPTIITTVVTVILDKPVESRIMNVLWSWLLTFFLLGSLFNPVIYCSRHTKRLEILHFRQT